MCPMDSYLEMADAKADAVQAFVVRRHDVDGVYYNYVAWKGH